MRRRCKYTNFKRTSEHTDREGMEHEGWLIAVVTFGNAVSFIIEREDGTVMRRHEAYTDLRLIAEDTPFPKPKKEKLDVDS